MVPPAPTQDADPTADAAPKRAAADGAGPEAGPERAGTPGVPAEPAAESPGRPPVAAAAEEVPARQAAPEQVAEGVTDEEVARYVAARGFVASTWLGAALLVFSFGQLYWSLLSGVYAAQVGLFLGLVVGSLGAAVFLRSRRVYRSMQVPYLRRSVAVANVVAGAGGIFWLLFFFLTALVWAGVEILPS